MPRITIGLPCYGRPAMLARALDSLLDQTERDFVLIIHENPSGSDEISRLVEKRMAIDGRIVYERHAENIGIVGNFMSVLAKAQSEFFLWAADDDTRHPEALSTMLAMMEAEPGAALAGCSVELINPVGETVDWHTGLARLTGAGTSSLTAFLAEPELLGKANLAYGLFRRQELLATFDAIGGSFPDCWGQDFVLLAAVFARFPVVVTDRILIRKRINVRSNRPLAKRFPQDYGCPEVEFARFREATLMAMPDDRLRALAAEILDGRQKHLSSVLCRVRRGVLRLLRLEAAAPTLPALSDRWQ